MPLAIGARLGPYEVLGPLGKGGMGEVYRARDARLGREVAIKVLPAETQTSLDHLSRFEQEARTVAALNHPNILALHDFGNESGIVYAVMELLEGDTLRDRLEQGGRFTPAKALDFAIQIARGLAAAHERGIVHRDLKPENLFVTREGRVKILDFGLAQQGALAASSVADHRTTRLATGPGLVVGTPGYISPEQMVGEAATPRSDLFAFGVVVHEMLTGSHPFARASLTETATAVLRDDPPPLEIAVPGLPGAAVKILERCVEKQAADRPGSARDLALYLEAIVAAGDRPGPLHAVAPPQLRRIRTSVVAVTYGLAILIATAPWGLVRLMAGRAVSAEIDDDLARADRLVRRVQADRLAALAVNARVVASFPELKALFATDQATVRDYLVSYQQRNPGAPLLLALSADAKLIARTDTVPAAENDDAWIAALLAGRAEPRVITIGGRPYHAAAAPADAGGTIFGYVVAATPVDAEFAAALREATQDEMLLLSDTAALASTVRSAQSPWRSRADWRLAGGDAGGTATVVIDTQEFVAREVPLVDQPAVSAVILKSRDEAYDPFRRIQNGLVILGLWCAAATAAAGMWIAWRIDAILQR